LVGNVGTAVVVAQGVTLCLAKIMQGEK